MFSVSYKTYLALLALLAERSKQLLLTGETVESDFQKGEGMNTLVQYSAAQPVSVSISNSIRPFFLSQ